MSPDDRLRLRHMVEAIEMKAIPVALSEQQENELLAAMEEIERGDFVTLDELLESLRKYG
jgi:predicted transcriptional regulator